MEIPKFPTQEELAKEVAEKAKKAAEGLEQAAQTLSEKGQALKKEAEHYFSIDKDKEQILTDLDEKNCTKSEHAAEVLAIYQATQDVRFVRDYLMKLPEGAGASLPPELQMKFANTVENFASTKGSGRMEYKKTLLIVNQALPAAAEAHLKAYEDGLEKPVLDYGVRVPPFIAGLPEEQRQTIFSNNPLAYARTFPDSTWVEGDVLETVLQEDFDSRWNDASSLDATTCGQAVWGEVPGTPRDMHEGHLLANVNLSGKQLLAVAKRLAQCSNAGGYDVQNTEQRANVNRIVARLLAHRASTPEVKNLLDRTFAVNALSQKNNKALGRTQNS